MKTWLCVAVLGGSILSNVAQDAPKQSELQKRAGNPIIAALDANHDGEIDATEINNAPAVLRKLDKNHDGKLTRQELRAGANAAEPAKEGTEASDKKALKKARKGKIQA